MRTQQRAGELDAQLAAVDVEEARELVAIEEAGCLQTADAVRSLHWGPAATTVIKEVARWLRPRAILDAIVIIYLAKFTPQCILAGR